MSPVSPVFHTVVAVSIGQKKHFNSSCFSFTSGETRGGWLRWPNKDLFPDLEFWALSTSLTEDRLRHASGPVRTQFRYMNNPKFLQKNFNIFCRLRNVFDATGDRQSPESFPTSTPNCSGSSSRNKDDGGLPESWYSSEVAERHLLWASDKTWRRHCALLLLQK